MAGPELLLDLPPYLWGHAGEALVAVVADALVGFQQERAVAQETRQSRRAVVLPELAATALVDHRVRQAAEREQQGVGWDEQSLVFPNTVGGPLDPHNLRERSFFPLLDRAGFAPYPLP